LRTGSNAQGSKQLEERAITHRPSVSIAEATDHAPLGPPVSPLANQDSNHDSYRWKRLISNIIVSIFNVPVSSRSFLVKLALLSHDRQLANLSQSVSLGPKLNTFSLSEKSMTSEDRPTESA
jgi:hypothetical protein